jgi:hypothetical protein
VDHLPVRARIGEFQGVDRSITKNENVYDHVCQRVLFLVGLDFERDSLRTRPQRKNGFFDLQVLLKKVSR